MVLRGGAENSHLQVSLGVFCIEYLSGSGGLMKEQNRRKSVLPLIVGCALVLLSSFGHAQKLVETSTEIRFQLDLHVSDDALRSLLPAGWTSNVAAQGPAKDANLRAIFVDTLAMNGPDGKPIGSGSNRYVYLVAPVKDPSGASVQLVIGGLTDDSADAPGPYGVYLRATTHMMKRSSISESGSVIELQDWNFSAPTGEHIEMHIQFARGVGNRGKASQTKYYSAKDPSRYQISEQQQVLQILRNATTNPPDQVKKFSFKASGGSYSKLFAGPLKVLSWDNILWIDRAVSTP